MKSVSLCITVVLSVGTIGYAQTNLVPNPSFEEYSACPEFAGDIDRATGWSSYRESPDYFNSCANAGLSVPSNALGYQNANNGIAYAGVVTFAKNQSDGREFFGSQLYQPLIAGAKYYFSLFISRADTFTLDGATNNFGLRFSSQFFTETNPAPISNLSHFHFDSIVTDKNGWTKISGSFVADSSYAFLMVGNFYDDAHTDTLQCASVAYYYVDDVCVTTDSLYNEHWSSVVSPGTAVPLDIYPLPADRELIVESPEVGAILTIVDVVGRQVHRDVLNGAVKRVNVAHLKSGAYLATIKHKNRNISKTIFIAH